MNINLITGGVNHAVEILKEQKEQNNRMILLYAADNEAIDEHIKKLKEEVKQNGKRNN
jgi:arylsulfatase A-like enzyme